jgi:nucleoside-diphosphate-sugar epimerase
MAQALFADEIAVGSLEPVRDMNFVSDTVDAFLAIAEADGVAGEVFNVGSGVGRSVAEMLDAVQRVAGSSKPVRQEAERVRPAASEVGALICSYEKARAAFGYEPKTEFEDGLARVRDYLAGAWRADPAAYRI